MTPPTYGNTVLLTGAGFTHGFGGFLAEDIWALIFNHRSIDKFTRVKAELRNEFNYEKIYNRIIEGEYEAEEKQALKNAIRDAYSQLDENVGQTHHDNTVNLLLERFSGEMGGSGFFSP